MLPPCSDCIAAFVFPKCCISTTSNGEDPQRALRYKDRENKEEELPAACQIQMEQHKDSSRHESEAARSTASACMANRAACVTCFYEHVRWRQAGALCDGRIKAWKWWFWSQPVNASKSWTDLGFPCLKITFKAIKLAEFRLQEHLQLHRQILAFVQVLAKVYFYPLLTDRKYKNHNPQ